MEKPTGKATYFSKSLESFMAALGLTEEPMGLFYADEKPAGGFAPKAQTPLDRFESTGETNWSSCVLSKVRMARRKKAAAWFDREHYGCLGGAFFMGFKPCYEPFEPALLAGGIPGKMEGERYVDSPQTGKNFYNAFNPPRASAPVLVIQPLSLFKTDQTPEIVVFFPDRRTMTGLNALTVFLTRDPDSVQMPFGLGCCGLISWPRRFMVQGVKKAVISGFDINCLKFLKKGEMTYAVPFPLFRDMLTKWPESLLGTRAWERLKK
ncbi:MAG: DUF169 domain-containing protein [Desulfobacterales bacterium]|nr:DUF169 domain-containing protein [Desulfobacterales bacterium]